ncbi:MAG: L,D-transpeptidase family protein [Candidatus Binatia bacterium]|nr:L,D-transpeptidase family protein [Candidatus Binatia bacterium]
MTNFVCHFVAILLTCCALSAICFAAPPSHHPDVTEAQPTPELVPPQEQQTLPRQGRGALYTIVVGRELIHEVAAGDTPAGLAKRYGVRLHTVLRRNGIRDPRRLRIGQRLVLSNRHIVPASFANGLVVDLPLLSLYWLHEGRVVANFPIAAGRPAWETPPGMYRIIGRRRNPTWYVPVSIQREMQAAGLRVRKRVLPGPDNPLGKYWIQLSAPGIGLHGTNAPWSVGRYATHGCIRLHEEHIEELFTKVPDGTPVAIVDEPVRLARTPDQRIFLEVLDRPEVWSPTQLESALEHAGLRAEIDWPLALQALTGRWGVAVDITATLLPESVYSPETDSAVHQSGEATH